MAKKIIHLLDHCICWYVGVSAEYVGVCAGIDQEDNPLSVFMFQD